MRRLLIIILSTFFLCLMVSDGWAQEITSSNFEKLKQLEGKWKGTKPDGKTVKVSFEITSGGSAVVETMMPEGEPNMVSVYHMNAGKLMMTHYCSAGNQPRMEASVTADENIDFNFVDATNLENKFEGHMQGLKVIFVDENHFNQVWNWSEDGKETPSTFEYKKVL